MLQAVEAFARSRLGEDKPTLRSRMTTGSPETPDRVTHIHAGRAQNWVLVLRPGSPPRRPRRVWRGHLGGARSHDGCWSAASSALPWATSLALVSPPTGMPGFSGEYTGNTYGIEYGTAPGARPELDVAEVECPEQ